MWLNILGFNHMLSPKEHKFGELTDVTSLGSNMC
jgi:hypothetical protein